jgi:hypothetical protein
MNHNKLDKAMSPEQFTQVVDAILEGKYSWACVLILRFAGYNPLHYIPYRTYNRLMKDNSQLRENHRQNVGNYATDHYPVNGISDLSFLETVEEDCPQVRGGRTLNTLVAYLSLADESQLPRNRVSLRNPISSTHWIKIE